MTIYLAALCIMTTIAAANPSTSPLQRALMRGDLDVIRRLSSSPGYNITADATQRTAFHYLLEGRKHTIVTQGEQLRGEHEQCIEVLAKAFPASLSVFCPLVDAVHHRNTVAVATLVTHSTADVLAACLEEKNVDGDTVLHVASDSMASGFGRHYIHQRRLNRRAAPAEGQHGTRASDVLQIGPAPQDATMPALNAAVGDWDLSYLLERAAPKVPVLCTVFLFFLHARCGLDMRALER